MDDTPNLKFPYIAAAQTQKHVTHNEAIRMLDALVQLSVRDRHLSTPPPSPAEGERYIVGPSPAGAWAGQENRVTAWQDGAWFFFTPAEGWVAWIADEDVLTAWSGTAWVLAGGGSVNPAPLVGVNATADTTNRLSVSSAASLFNHAGNGHQVKINKNAAGDTASFLFQTAFSGRAEMGTAGDDDFHFKVSPNGSTFFEAMVIDRTNGIARFPAGVRMVDGTKISNGGNTAQSGLELEGGGTLGKVALVVKSVGGLTGALFEQRATNPGIDLIDFGFKTLTQQVNMRVESRPAFSATGSAPEVQFNNITTTSENNLLAISPLQTAVQSPLALKSYEVAGLPAASSVRAGAHIYVSNASGGAVPAFSDGVNWRRVTDRTVVS